MEEKRKESRRKYLPGKARLRGKSLIKKLNGPSNNFFPI